MKQPQTPHLRALAIATSLGLVFAVGASTASARVGLLATPPAASAANADTAFEQVQYRRGYAPRAYGGPRYYGPQRYYGPPRAYGGPGPVWAYRPWYRRPYYGTIIGGIALGSIIGAAAYYNAPRPPRPDLCWYWADDIQTSGYWDYC